MTNREIDAASLKELVVALRESFASRSIPPDLPVAGQLVHCDHYVTTLVHLIQSVSRSIGTVCVLWPSGKHSGVPGASFHYPAGMGLDSQDAYGDTASIALVRLYLKAVNRWPMEDTRCSGQS